MSDLVVRYVKGQFIPPTEDNPYKRSPTQHGEVRDLDVQATVVAQYLVQQAKSGASAVVSRVGEATGNRSLGRTLRFGSEVIGDASAVFIGFRSGGFVGAGVAIAAVGARRGIEAYDLALERRKATIESDELARRAGFTRVNKRSENR